MAPTTESKLNGFADYLVTQGYLDKQTAHLALVEALRKKMTLIHYLCKNELLTNLKAAEILAEYFGLSLFNLENYDLKSLPAEVPTLDLIQRYNILPLYKTDNQLVIGVADPTAIDLTEINFLVGLTCIFLIVEFDKMSKIMTNIQSAKIEKHFMMDETELSLPDYNFTLSTDIDLSKIELDQAPIIKLLNKILIAAINQKASDIHFEPYENFYRVRIRLDGILRELHRLSTDVMHYFTTRLKVMANLDIAERRLPQDGRLKAYLSKNHAVDFRLSTCPVLHGEKLVLRILTSTSNQLNMNTQGFNETQKIQFLEALSQPQGMILMTGPTGSGKTSSLYTALNQLNRTEINIATVEDPIEIYLPGINQVQINSKIGLTFATALRAFLRQDPDIMMVGEIRDLETAEIAIKAAQTGHLVLSTLHTNSATHTLTRLASMGVAPFNVASSITLIIAQRLVRMLCDHCKLPHKISEKILLNAGFKMDELPSLALYQANGCHQCYKGYKGRIGIYEVLPISHQMRQLIMGQANSLLLAAQARKENIADLRFSGLEKVRMGITSLDEINRVQRYNT